MDFRRLPEKRSSRSSRWACLLPIGFIPAIGMILCWPGCGPSEDRIELGDRLVGNLETSDRFIGSRACQACHPGEYASYMRSGHSQTLRPAAEVPIAEKLDGRVQVDPEDPSVLWRFRLKEVGLTVERTDSSGNTETKDIHYALGSGHHATTFLSMTNLAREKPEALEHRLTHFVMGDRLALTPGQDESHYVITEWGRELLTPSTLKCLRCHTTRLSSYSESMFDARSLIPNISCERCHGPARRHVEAATRGQPGPALNMAGADDPAEVQLEFCGVCHRHPSRVPRDVLYPENTALARFQPVGLSQSRCYTESDGELNCGTCHDPHARASTNASMYVETCLKCHSGDHDGASICAASFDDGCVECHMPGVDSGQGVLFTDHWIRVRR